MWAVAFVCAVYSGAFLFGFIGNLWVIIALYRSRLFCLSRHYAPVPLTPSERLRAFIFVLAVADFMVLLTVPMSVLHIFLGRWPFGDFLCRTHTAIDRGGKLFSVVVLTAMSLQRYLVVCTRWRYTASTTLTTFIPITVGILACVIVPIVWEVRYTKIVPYVYEVAFFFAFFTRKDFKIFTFLKLGNTTTSPVVCLSEIPENISPFFINYTFICGFAMPLCVMAICYFMLVRHVRKRFLERKGFNTSQIQRPRYMCELTKSIWRIAIFHFTCWAPYYFFTASPSVAQLLHLPPPETNATWFQTGRLIGNMLPYINSAGNWILYAFLNRDVRNHIIRRDSRSSKYGFTPVTVSYRATTS
uniref:G-protein coupled receptors family 1 profile domain-containing protein n=1 Tax=Panagrolaimus superbus TaxID=310955 RepID=A0A914YT84_9BILA